MHLHQGLLLIAHLHFYFANADVTTGFPDAAPPGFEQWVSEIVIPAKPVAGDADWAGAVNKARQFVSGLTLEEKVNLTTGVGTSGRCVGNTGAVTRLGFPGFCLQDSPLGVRNADFVSAFPAAINVAATFDASLMNARGIAMGAEHRGKGVNVALGPMTNLGRVAAGGRNWEGFGADPFLAGVGTAETVKGYQSQGVISCVKHLIANEQEHFRGGSQAAQIYSSNLDDQTLHEVYLWPFAEAVRAGVGSVMCSYNKLNQTQTCQSSKLLNGVLKEELDFQGFIVSDWAAMINGVQPAIAGLDMNMPGFMAYGQGPQGFVPTNTTNSWWGSNLIEAVNNGSVSVERLDDMVTRSMTAFFKLGQDNGYPALNFDYTTEDTFSGGMLVNEHINVQADHYKLIREIGSASTVLLKNTHNALPLSTKNIKRIAILGSDAGPNLDGPNGCSDRGCNQGTLAMGWGSGTANFPYLIDPASAIQNFVHSQNPTIPIEVVLNDFNHAQVTSVSSQADVCLVFVNADSGEGYITVDGNAGDRNNLTLWHGGEDLISTTTSACSNTIVVMHIVGPVLVESWFDNPNITAVLNAGIPGQESGNAIVDILFGGVNPSARLPYTVPKQRSDYGVDVLYASSMTTPQLTYEEGVKIDYRHFDANGIVPRFEFGFGLSYTEFSYSGLSIRKVGGKRRRNSDVLPAVAPAAQTPASAPKPSTPVGSTLSPIASKPSGVPGTPSTHASPPASSISSGMPSGSATHPPITSVTLPPITNITLPPITNITSPPIANSTNPPASNTTTAPPAITSPVEHSPGGPAALYDVAFKVTYSIQNTGGTDGNEVSQVYLGFPPGANQPPKLLRGFDRTFIKKGKKASITVTLREKDISIWNVVTQKWEVPKGAFQVFVGSSSRKIHLTGSFTP
ncbi:glycoside hydrolase superfamily [Hysterangium stoloniferum]|nr:glycoside hydrolase superfamily [Hysterangium stoloniferum]